MKNNTNIKKILRELPVFAGLAPESLRELARASRCVTFPRDQSIYRAGDLANKMYVLLSGQVKLALSCDRGNEKIIEVIDAGQTFGEAELFGTHRYLAGAATVKPSQLLYIAGRNLCHVMALDPRLAVRIMRMLAQRQIQMEAEAAAIHHCSNGQRLLDFFLSLADPGRDLAGETLVTLGISKQLLASRLDMQPESLSRTLRNLAESGLIAVEGCRIKLNNAGIASYLAHQASARPAILPDRWHPSAARGIRHSIMVTGPGAEIRIADGRPWCDAINKAGRQRMLSQRMAKSWLMLEQGVLARRARVILKRSMDMFDRQLKELGTPVNGVEIAAAGAELAEVWKPYRALLESAPSRKGARRLFDMNEEVLDAAQRLTLSFEHADGTRHGKLINLAGRERMLSQRMAKFFMFAHMDIQAPESRAELEGANEEFSSALVMLASAVQDKPKIAAELERVGKHWKALQSAIAVRHDADFAVTASKVCTISEHLLRRMDTAVELYAKLPG